jgi:hypothetical protein
MLPTAFDVAQSELYFSSYPAAMVAQPEVPAVPEAGAVQAGRLQFLLRAMPQVRRAALLRGASHRDKQPVDRYRRPVDAANGRRAGR